MSTPLSKFFVSSFFVEFMIVICLGFSFANADETAPSQCGRSFTVSGEIHHSKKKTGQLVVGATKPDFYDEEVYGKHFSASAAGLPEGRYTVEIYLSENYYSLPGERIMDISAGSRKLAESLDLYTVAGFSKEYVVTAQVDHKEDFIEGPLAISFEAKSGFAKFNAIEVKDAAGDGVACVLARELTEIEDPHAVMIPDIKQPPIYTDPEQPVEKRVVDLIDRMSLKEKVSQLMNNAPSIDRLKVPGYEYWNECLHGVGLAGKATVFPQAIGLAAMWNPEELQQIADTIATEGRAKNNEARATNPNTARFFGLTFWSPNINIFRDPRWGRGQETYGEDPFLTAQLGVAFIRGLQGKDPRYLKVMACAKHFAVHSGPEKLRHTFDAVVSERDLYETYLPQFEAAVKQGRPGQVMSVYNALDGVPGPVNKFLLTDLLHTSWGFGGLVVSDCGAVRDVWENHKFVKTAAEASALAIRAGNDLECGSTFSSLASAVNQNLITEKEIDTALERVLTARFRLGLFDSAERCAYLRIPPSENNSPAHDALATEAARESLVLLKNDGVLPLDRATVRRIALIGPNADSVRALLGNYYGDPVKPTTLLQGLKDAAGTGIQIVYAPGCPIAAKLGEVISNNTPEVQEAIRIAGLADVVVFAGGIDGSMEGEEMKTVYQGFDRGDRTGIELPAIQTELLKRLMQTGKPVVFVNFSGGAMAMPWAAEHVQGIIQAWYPGQNGGRAVADVLFGDFNPAGRLPVTFYTSTADLPEFVNYAMSNRTYRYFNGKALFPFGYGLSYTRFDFEQPRLSSLSFPSNGVVAMSINIKNSGMRDGTEVVQAYVKNLNCKVPMPIHSLAAFRRVNIAKGKTATVVLEIPASAFQYWDVGTHRYVIPEGKVEIQVGASSADIRDTVRVQITDPKS
jgi:beta-glucosidase